MQSILFTSAAYLVLFISLRHLQPSGIVFYQGVLLALLAAAGQALVLRFVRSGSWGLILKDSAFSFLLLYSAVFTIPTTVDRAYSVRMILEIQRTPEGLTRAQIEHWFATDFQSQGGVEKRLHEQLVTGTIEQEGERYRLTTTGLWLAQSFGVVQSLFSTSAWKR